MPPSKQDILSQLEALHTMAVAEGNITAALRATELMGKLLGLFKDTTEKINISQLTDEQIKEILKELD